jgi:DNA-binding XRE family transcriptional regulator
METTKCNPRLSGRNGVAQTVARTIIIWRGRLEMTQTKLAELSGVSRKRVNEIEAGCESEIHGSTLFRLALALCVTPNVLYGYADPGYTPNPRLTPLAARVFHDGLL